MSSGRHGTSNQGKGYQAFAPWKGPKPGTHSHSASQSQRWKCQGTGGCGYAWNIFSQGTCQSCNAPWQFEKRSAQRDGRNPSGKGGGSGTGKDKVPPKSQWPSDTNPKSSAHKPISTRWGNWEWSWDSDRVDDATGTEVVDEAKQLCVDIAIIEKDIAQLEAVLGKDHGEVMDRKGKLEALQIRQKANEPVMPHEQKLRKHLWEVRDCDVKIKKAAGLL